MTYKLLLKSFISCSLSERTTVEGAKKGSKEI